jgi:hypothetical protein
MALPVRRTAKPTQNAPAWALGLVGLFGAIKTATDGSPAWVPVVVFVACVAFGIYTQTFTSPHR